MTEFQSPQCLYSHAINQLWCPVVRNLIVFGIIATSREICLLEKKKRLRS